MGQAGQSPGGGKWVWPMDRANPFSGKVLIFCAEKCLLEAARGTGHESSAVLSVI